MLAKRINGVTARRLIATGLLAGLLSGPAAQAGGFVNGSFSVVGGFACDDCYSPGDDHIVSHLVELEAANPAVASAGTEAFAGIDDVDVVPTKAVFLSDPPPDIGRFDFAGFTLTINHVGSVLRSALVCAGGVCQDSLRFRLWGEVSGNGYRVTPIAGIWTGQGSCLGGAGVCTSEPTASWSASFSAIPVPEPDGLALLGLGVLAVGVLARLRARRAKVTRATSD
jgi:hypothetical protein